MKGYWVTHSTVEKFRERSIGHSKQEFHPKPYLRTNLIRKEQLRKGHANRPLHHVY